MITMTVLLVLAVAFVCMGAIIRARFFRELLFTLAGISLVAALSVAVFANYAPRAASKIDGLSLPTTETDPFGELGVTQGELDFIMDAYRVHESQLVALEADMNAGIIDLDTFRKRATASAQAMGARIEGRLGYQRTAQLADAMQEWVDELHELAREPQQAPRAPGGMPGTLGPGSWR